MFLAAYCAQQAYQFAPGQPCFSHGRQEVLVGIVAVDWAAEMHTVLRQLSQGVTKTKGDPDTRNSRLTVLQQKLTT